MRIAILSDIHGNLTALEAALADLRETAPDLILHGGDLGDNGSRPAEVVDRIRDLGWPGVVGNTDEMLFAPETLAEFAGRSSGLEAMFSAIEEMAAASRAIMGEGRLAWLRSLPPVHVAGPVALVHASPGSRWTSPAHAASDAEFQETYGPLGQPIAVYGHIHVPFVRKLEGLTVANSGSVGLPYDGDRRASYLLVDGSMPFIRRVEYDVDCELKALVQCGRPHAGWVVRMLECARPQML